MIVYRAIPWFLIPYLERVEGERRVAYRDQGGVWTDGVGSTKGVTPGAVWTQAQIDAHLRADLQVAVERLYWAIGPAAVIRLKDHEYAALLSFVFNDGEEAKWTIWSDIRSGDLSAVPEELEHFVHVNGRVDKGLVNRRKADVALWLGIDPVLKLQPPHSGVTGGPNA